MDRKANLAVCLIALASAACSRGSAIVVASKNFTESVLLGEIVAQHLESLGGFEVRRKLNLGGTLLAHEALVNGDIDLYPEYTGTAITNVLKIPARAATTMSVEETVRQEYARRWNIDVLPPLGFDNSFAMVIRGTEQAGITSLSQAAARTKPWRLGVGYEFETRPDGLAGFQRTYNLPLVGPPKNMDLGLLYQALRNNEVDLIAASATDGQLANGDLRVLDDDRKFFPPYQAVLLVRSEALSRRPALRQALVSLSGKLPARVMRELNYRVDEKKETVESVAAGWLKTLSR